MCYGTVSTQRHHSTLRTVRHQCLYPLHWKLAAVHSLFLNLKNKKNKHKKQQCIDKHLWLNPIRYLYINSVYPAGSFVPELVSDTRYNVLVYVCAHLLEVFREKKMFVRAFTSHIIAERFIKNKYPFVIAKDTTWKYPPTQDSGRNFKRQALTQVLWVTGNISVKRKDVKNIHFIYNNFYVAFGRWNVLITAPFVKK